MCSFGDFRVLQAIFRGAGSVDVLRRRNDLAIENLNLKGIRTINLSKESTESNINFYKQV